jgi:hypothetical protein
MPTLPAYCSNCDRWFPSFIEIGEGSKNITISNNSMQCSKCGNAAPIYDGIYNAIGDTIEIIKSHDLTAKELKDLSRILQQAIKQNTPAGQIRETIAREIPKASGINKLITDKAGLYALVMLILAVLQNVIPLLLSSSSNQIDTEKIVKAILESKTQSTTEPKTKVGVNDPCECGSGRKKKKCQGSKNRPNSPIKSKH